MGLLNFLKDPFGYDIFGVEEEDEDIFYGHLYCFGGSSKKQNQEDSSDDIGQSFPTSLLVFGVLMTIGLIIVAIILILILILSLAL